MSYVDGTLEILTTPLRLSVAPAFIGNGDVAPQSFQVTAEGLVCNDPVPEINSFRIEDATGTVVTGSLTEGIYSVYPELSGLVGYDFYEISVEPGTLYVNPEVGCNDRIKAADICRSDAQDPEDPAITTRLVFTYINQLDVPIYIPLGKDNKLKGNAHFTGTPPVLFMPGTHTFEVFTDGGSLQWEIITPGCKSASKSANGSNADPCGTNLQSKTDLFTDYATEAPVGQVYPNPATDFLHLYVGDQEGTITVQVFDQVGRLLKQGDYEVSGVQVIDVDVANLKSGLLLVRIEEGQKSSVFRILKQ